MKLGLHFKIGGVVKGIYVTEGQSVQQGQLLASLDLTEIEAQQIRPKNNVENLKRDLNEWSLAQRFCHTRNVAECAKTGYDVAVESLRIAEFNREYATTKRLRRENFAKLLNAGELAAPGTPVFMMNATGPDEWIVKLASAWCGLGARAKRQ